MMNSLKYIFLSLFLASFIGACETDFDTTSSWEDITVVYGILDQLDSEYYIRVNRAFLGEGNAFVYAEQLDSINYEEELDVKIYELDDNGNTVNTIEFEKDTIPEGEQGANDTIFPGGQIVYVGGVDEPYSTLYDGTKLWLNDEHTYLLKVIFPSSSKEVTAETILVKDFTIVLPFQWDPDIEFVNNPIATTAFKWTKPANDVNNAFRYEIDLLFHYREETLGGEVSDRIVKLSNFTFAQSQVNDEMIYSYNDESFFTSCENQILYEDGTESNIRYRYTGNVDFIVSVAAEELNLFMEVYQPSNSIVQEKPPYTNIENGIGIFSSRYYVKTIKDLDLETVNELIDIDNNVMKFAY